MGNYSGEVLGDFEEDGKLREFSADTYKRVTGLNRPRLYLLSKSLYDSDEEEEEEELHCPTFHNSDPPTNPSASHTFYENAESFDENGFQLHPANQSASLLIGSSEERKKLFEELEDQVAKSAAADREKEENKKREREVTKERVEDAIRRAKEEDEELEVLRKRRELSVSPRARRQRGMLSRMRQAHSSWNSDTEIQEGFYHEPTGMVP
ncbi:hypothetical protein OS493_019490 [Desmophyllum pertusum]|uniref:Uncharacterized protein n=1 Tax=Desmophyllum pertusum TaxID=174260 RepID=A0A9W9ZN84_9CNID|nr:hypothetical protein OS493_019490 [Desmophyllum pertusum]